MIILVPNNGIFFAPEKDIWEKYEENIIKNGEFVFAQARGGHLRFKVEI